MGRERARGLHAAYAQCAALRRMLTALRVSRLLMRWRVAVEALTVEEAHAHQARLQEQHSLLDKILEESVNRIDLLGDLLRAVRAKIKN